MNDFLKKIDKEAGFSDAFKVGTKVKENMLSYSDLKNLLSSLKEYKIYENIDWYRDSNNRFLIIEIKNENLTYKDEGIAELIFTCNGGFKIKAEDNNVIMYFKYMLKED